MGRVGIKVGHSWVYKPVETRPMAPSVLRDEPVYDGGKSLDLRARELRTGPLNWVRGELQACRDLRALQPPIQRTLFQSFFRRLSRAASIPIPAARVAPNGTISLRVSPTRQPAQPLCGGAAGGPDAPLPVDAPASEVAAAEGTAGGGSGATEDAAEGAAEGVFGAAAYIAGAGTNGPLSIFVSLSSRATIATKSNPPRLANASFCAASVPLAAVPRGGPPQIPRCGFAHFTAPVHACRIA